MDETRHESDTLLANIPRGSGDALKAPDDRPVATLVAATFWISGVAWWVANGAAARRHEWLLPCFALHVCAMFGFLINASYILCGGRVWTLRRAAKLQGPLCDCCCYPARYDGPPSCALPANRARGCCGCSCMSKPYAVASVIFAVLLFATPPASSLGETALSVPTALEGAPDAAPRRSDPTAERPVGAGFVGRTVTAGAAGVGGPDPLRAMHRTQVQPPQQRGRAASNSTPSTLVAS